MNPVSSPVTSSQCGIHNRLESVVRRHMTSAWRQPLHRPTITAFEQLISLPDFDPDSRLILDSGCGTGASTLSIANCFPDCQVIGVDRSGARLSRLGQKQFPVLKDNAIWVQAELASFWRLAVKNGWKLERHYLLFPNPWPKPGQLQRRWHAHPVFPQMLELGGLLEMRCNWEIYAQEFACAIQLACDGVVIETESSDSELSWGGVETPFGRKYGKSGHRLYRVVADLRPTNN
jgi:tRNA G46 methylase TrmB